jgi:CubicO group peptidase (beta-lactamase class C family)
VIPAASFDALHAALREQVDREFLPGVSTALLRGREVVDTFVHGWADREARVPLREDHLFRIFSNTKLVTSCAVMLLVEQGRLALDDPLERWIPQLGARRVLRPGARTIDDTEPARTPVTIRHLMAHTAGLSYGIFEPGTVLARSYAQARVLDRHADLAGLVDALAPLPLAFHPGTRWEYSVATDVLGRVVEVVTGQRFGAFLAECIFGPLGMVDTGFWVPPAQQHRLCALYQGVDRRDPARPGLARVDDKPWPGAYLAPIAREGGGGGLVSTLGDMVRLLQALVPGGPTLLAPATLAEMWRNQLPAGMPVAIPNTPPYEGRGFGLGSSIVLRPGANDPRDSAGEVAWGGMAGTMWWIHPGHGIAGVLMTQRYFGSGHPYGIVFKREAYRALGLQ